MSNPKVVIIATTGLTTNLLYNGLSKETDVKGVFIENPESKKVMIQRRLKKLGFSRTLGQLLFLVVALPFIPRRKKRIAEIIQQAELKNDPIPSSVITRITTVHDPELSGRINALNPDLIIINGTRILKSAFLDAITCPIANIHVGITPKYRGVHGGYWALFFNEPHLFGVTLHLVDKGIDTGNIVAQTIVPVKQDDNYRTYPILQYCAGIELALKHHQAISNQSAEPVAPITNESRLHYHPTLWNYLRGKA